jgi:formylglycine-generating enzyme required for sulfatase activity
MVIFETMQILFPMPVLVALCLLVIPTAYSGEAGKPLSTFKDCDFCPEMVVIPAGHFTMGSPKSEIGRRVNEGPQHLVELERFSIGKYELTYAEYDYFSLDTGRKKANESIMDRDEMPLTDVSHYDAVAYAQWLSDKTGQSYRLPTSAEWEYAARAGSTTSYPWGDEIGANLAQCKGCKSQWDKSKPAPVGSFPPNNWGLHDTVGNVVEWTCSEFEPSYKGEELRCSEVAGDAVRIVTRGGSYNYPSQKVRTAFFYRLPPMSSPTDLGFRLVQQ